MKPVTLLVTGGCGYLGARFLHDASREARFASWTIRVVDNLAHGSYAALADLGPVGRIEFVDGDILDHSTLRLALQGADCVLHLAGIVTTPVSFDHDRSMEQVNHWGTANLVDACLQSGVPKLVYSSSIAVYGPGTALAEDATCRPVGSYARTVRSAELCILGARARGLETRVLRMGTVYGFAPNMRFDNVINRLAMLAATGKPLTVFGSGMQRRPVVHVCDASSLLLHAVADSTMPAVLNVAESSPSILEVVDATRDVAPDIAVRYTEQDILTHLSFDVGTERLQALGWKPGWPISRGVADVISHFHGVRAMHLPIPPVD